MIFDFHNACICALDMLCTRSFLFIVAERSFRLKMRLEKFLYIRKSKFQLQIIKNQSDGYFDSLGNFLISITRQQFPLNDTRVVCEQKKLSMITQNNFHVFVNFTVQFSHLIPLNRDIST